MNKSRDKNKKNGNPLVIIFIFIILIFFVFYVPEIYKKYNSEITNFLSKYNLEKLTSNKETESTEKEIDPVSNFINLNSNGTLKFNELEFSEITLIDNIFKATIKSEKVKYLDKLNYYLEFYDENNTFLGRRSLKGNLNNGVITLEWDVTNLNLSSNCKLAVSHITVEGISNYELQNENLLTCKMENNLYSYTFDENKLNKVTFKYENKYLDIEKYSNDLVYYQDLTTSFKEYNGVTSDITSDNYLITFTGTWDYSSIQNYNEQLFDKYYLFQKDVTPGIIKFTLEAEGFDCQ